MGEMSKTSNWNRVNKHLFGVSMDAVELYRKGIFSSFGFQREKSPELGFAGWVEVALVKKISKILQEKEIAYAKTQKCILGGGEGQGRSL